MVQLSQEGIPDTRQLGLDSLGRYDLWGRVVCKWDGDPCIGWQGRRLVLQEWHGLLNALDVLEAFALLSF